jgi:molybdopterin-binding protein
MPVFRIREAADLLGVSYDTMLRWADSGRIGKTTDAAGRLAVDGAALAQFARERAESAAGADGPVAAHSVRNRFTGLVTRVIRDTVMAQVEIQAGPHRFVSLLSREAADELALEPGMLAVAAVKATNVSVEIPVAVARRPASRPSGAAEDRGALSLAEGRVTAAPVQQRGGAVTGRLHVADAADDDFVVAPG